MNFTRNIFGLGRSIGSLIEMKSISTCARSAGTLFSWCRPLVSRDGRLLSLRSPLPLGVCAPVRGVLNTPIKRPPIDTRGDFFMEALTAIPPKAKKAKKRPLDGRHKMKGVIVKLMILHPRKPNSGNRKCCKVRLQNGVVHRVHIPGIGHNLQEHNVVMVREAKTKDISLKLKVIRGELDCAPVVKVRTRQPMVREVKEED